MDYLKPEQNTQPKILDFQQMQRDAFVDVNEQLPDPPVALSMGEIHLAQKMYYRAFGTYGNFSLITGASKAKKTFLKSLIVGSYIGGRANEYAPDFKGHRDKDKFILDFDTEQSKWHAQRVFQRVPKITNKSFIDGEDYSFYKPFYLRKYNYKERMQFIEWCMLESEYRDNIGFVCIDGFADLVKDVNDLPSSNELMDKLLNWTDITQCHLTGILHKNYGSAKPTGHLGSAILKKAETVCMLDLNEEDESYTDVSFPYTRGFPIDDFKFTINEFGLPVIDKY